MSELELFAKLSDQLVSRVDEGHRRLRDSIEQISEDVGSVKKSVTDISTRLTVVETERSTERRLALNRGAVIGTASGVGTAILMKLADFLHIGKT